MGNYDPEYLRYIRSGFDIRICDRDSTKRCIKKLRIAKLGDLEVDGCYDWFLGLICENEDKEFICKDQNEYADNNEDAEEHEDEGEGVSVDENIKDPEYCLFLENLKEHGKSYKLKISQDDEEPRFLFYEEHDSLDRCNDLQTDIDDSGDELTGSEDRQTKQKAKRIFNKKKISETEKINEHKTKTQSPHNLVTLEPCHPIKCKEEPVEYEKQITTSDSDSDSDSDVVILDKVQNCSEVNNKQIVLAEKEPSLREKLMHILMQPYNEKEYKELSEYIEQEKPVSLLKPLRNGRSRLYANAGVNKRMLDYGPEKFQRLLTAAQNDPPKALNLLRMFSFWLEHVPNDDVFQPWRDKQILKVRPSEENALTHMQQAQLLLDYK